MESSFVHRPLNPNLVRLDPIPDFLLHHKKSKRSQACSVNMNNIILLLLTAETGHSYRFEPLKFLADQTHTFVHPIKKHPAATYPSHEVGEGEDVSEIPGNSDVSQNATPPQLFQLSPGKSLHMSNPKYESARFNGDQPKSKVLQAVLDGGQPEPTR